MGLNKPLALLKMQIGVENVLSDPWDKRRSSDSRVGCAPAVP